MMSAEHIREQLKKTMEESVHHISIMEARVRLTWVLKKAIEGLFYRISSRLRTPGPAPLPLCGRSFDLTQIVVLCPLPYRKANEIHYLTCEEID
jgi:hypothetical protein